MVMDQIKQIDQNQDNNINTQELLDAIKPNWFLRNENNLEEVWKLLNNEELNEGDKTLLNSLTKTIDEEINRIIENRKVTEEDILLIKVWNDLLGEGDPRVQRLEELINWEQNNIDNQNHEVEIDLKEGNEDNDRLIKKYETLNINERQLLNMIFDENDIVGSIDKFLDSQEIIKNWNKIKINILEKKSKNAEIINILQQRGE